MGLASLTPHLPFVPPSSVILTTTPSNMSLRLPSQRRRRIIHPNDALWVCFVGSHCVKLLESIAFTRPGNCKSQMKKYGKLDPKSRSPSHAARRELSVLEFNKFVRQRAENVPIKIWLAVRRQIGTTSMLPPSAPCSLRSSWNPVMQTCLFFKYPSKSGSNGRRDKIE